MKNIVSLLTEVHERISHSKGNGFANTVEEDISFLNNLPTPQDDIERSHSQHVCQLHNNNSKLQRIIYDIGSGLILVPVIIYFRLKRKKLDPENKDAVMLKNYYSMGIMPDTLAKEIDSYAISSYEKGSLSKEDLALIKELWRRYPLEFFLFKCATRIAAYSEIINRYQPKCICASCEYSCTSSVLTYYCEKHGVKHVNIMHGEKLLNIRESFCRFHYFYIWDEHYKKLFQDLKAEETKYLVWKPNIPNIVKKEEKHATYYLQLHTYEELIAIKESLEKIDPDYMVRPHPSHYTKEIDEVFDADRIEDTKQINIWDSLGACSCVVSGYSTVLLQAYWAGIPTIIDDISNREIFEDLCSRKYIMIDKADQFLSELIMIK